MENKRNIKEIVMNKDNSYIKIYYTNGEYELKELAGY